MMLSFKPNKMQTWVMAQGHVAFKHHNKIQNQENAEMVGLGPLPDNHRFWYA